MKAYWGSGCIVPRIRDLGTRERRVLRFMPQPFYPQGKSPQYPLDRLGGPQSRSRRCDREKNFSPPPGIEPPIIQPRRQNVETYLK
jgi:hypothetical protein